MLWLKVFCQHCNVVSSFDPTKKNEIKCLSCGSTRVETVKMERIEKRNSDYFDDVKSINNGVSDVPEFQRLPIKLKQYILTKTSIKSPKTFAVLVYLSDGKSVTNRDIMTATSMKFSSNIYTIMKVLERNRIVIKEKTNKGHNLYILNQELL